MFDNRRNILDYIIQNENKKNDTIVNFKPTHTIIDILNYKKVVELGVRCGKHFNTFVKSKADVIIGCDLWLDSDNIYENDKCFSQEQQNELMTNVINTYSHDKRVQIIRHDSSSLAENYNDNEFDLVFIDADHSYEGAKKDIYAWYNKVKDGGILCGHDYEKYGITVKGKYYKFGVMDAVDEFVKEKKLCDKLYITPKKGHWGGGIPCWYILK